MLLAEAAAAAGLISQCFDNGSDALEAAPESNVAIALLDVSMPGLDGLSKCAGACARIRASTACPS